ncbi:3-isopropylmalate dehydratase small subunit [Roseibium sp. MMSF_3412]|uniref:3-isopropylmalate dehydratase small subunit n=1 Tax=Roseibium sp. MMSF_3412 TaxID=3046712 RepID=UPI00273FDF67|nr:3-isopropylmalate dehydratase small subunit [Roseibium sp. MMSF_3412]
MSGWTKHSGQAVALPFHNIDTDQLIPSRFMSTPRSEGYGRFLLHDLRRDESGSEHPHFPLNRHKDTSIVVAGRNFGSGSSREAAVYALVDAGIRAVFAPSFGDIFSGNAVNNGLLPALIQDADFELLLRALGDASRPAHVCLDARHISIDGTTIGFQIDPGRRTKLINGWDDIDLTMQHAAAIGQHKRRLDSHAPWVRPVTERTGS